MDIWSTQRFLKEDRKTTRMHTQIPRTHHDISVHGDTSCRLTNVEGQFPARVPTCLGLCQVVPATTKGGRGLERCEANRAINDHSLNRHPP